jgi:hypothetical protein
MAEVTEEKVEVNVEAWAETLDAPVTTRGVVADYVGQMLESREAMSDDAGPDVESLRRDRHTLNVRKGLWKLTRSLGETLLFVLTAPSDRLVVSLGIAIGAGKIVEAIVHAYERLSDDELQVYEAVLRYSHEKARPPTEAELTGYVDEALRRRIPECLSSMIHTKAVIALAEGKLITQV